MAVISYVTEDGAALPNDSPPPLELGETIFDVEYLLVNNVTCII